MTPKLPRSPFSTPLSGSAREVEERIRNIFQYKKKRPPLLFFLLACVLALSCGGLVSCEGQSPASSLSREEETLLSLLAAEDQTYHEEGDEPRLLASLEQGDYLLGAAACSHRFGDTLLIGVMDRQTGELTGPVYQQGIYYGTPYVTTFQQNGASYLLYTHNGMHQGISYGSAGLVTLQGDDFTWTWPVEGDLRDESSQAFADHNTYWEDHIALLAPGGVDVFAATGSDVITGAGPQWAVDHSENFYIPEEGDLPIPIPYQTRVWVEDFTRDRNALSASNRSALYHIVSMKAEEPVPGQREGDPLYSMLAFCDGEAENGEGGWFSAVLLFDQETGQVGDVLAWAQGDREEVELPRERWANALEKSRTSPGMESQEFYGLLADALAEYYQGETVYFASDQPDVPIVGERRFHQVSYVGQVESPTGTLWEDYLVEQSVYLDQGASNEWMSMEPLYCIVERGADGTFLQSLGLVPAAAVEGMEHSQVILQTVYGLLDIEASLWPEDAAQGPVGLGAWRNIFSLAPEDELSVERLVDGASTYNPGDYWERWSIDGFTALRYHNWAAGTLSVYSIETTRSDLCTYRGIRVGDSREAVRAAYPELKSGDYWGRYPGEDVLWYCDSSMDLGPALLFFFENDRVSRIVLYNMFD